MNQQRILQQRVGGRARKSTPGSDEGMTLVEVLVAILLTGTLAVAGMVSLRASIVASGIDRDHANAHAWLQTASDVLYGAELEDCGSQTSTAAQAAIDAERVAQAYEVIVRGTLNPQGWRPEKIAVVRPVKFWDGVDQFANICYADSGIGLQLIKLQVTGPDGRIVESVEIVKG